MQPLGCLLEKIGGQNWHVFPALAQWRDFERKDAQPKIEVLAKAAVAVVSAFDESGLRQVLQQSKTEVVINQLTALPSDPSQIAAAIQGDRKLRLEGAATCCLPRERPACADTCSS
jgi:hypothetical protein